MHHHCLEKDTRDLFHQEDGAQQLMLNDTGGSMNDSRNSVRLVNVKPNSQPCEPTCS